MRARTERRVTAWKTRPTEDGYAGLHALSEASFSGIVASEGAWLFLIDGRPVGLTGGSIESFADAPLDAYVAPHRALPLLFAMRERGGEVRGRYYTGDTPLSEVAEALSAGGFTGYVELSENVLSGEYHLVYHRGRSTAVAFVGEQERLLTDGEARDRADREVGIYEVRAVGVEEIDLPDPVGSSSTAPATSLSEPASTEEVSAERSEPAPNPGVDAESADHGSKADPDSDDGSRGSADPEPGTGPEPDGVADPPVGTASAEEEPSAEHGSATADGAGTDPETSSAASIDDPSGSGALDVSGDDADESRIETGGPMEPSAGSAEVNEPFEPIDRWGSVIDEPVEDRLAAERQWRETVRIPSIEPDGDDSTTDSADPATPDPPGSDAGSGPGETTGSGPEETSGSEPDTGTEAPVERRTLDGIEADVGRLREEVASLRERVDRIEESETDPPVPGDDHGRAETLPPARALEATNLFVRYANAGEATLDAAHSAGADRESVVENLRLERHTGFDPGEVAVDGRPFEEFLEGRLEYRFADWLVGELLFDLGETGHEGGLAGLYDALPRIDRIEFDGTVDAGADEDAPAEETDTPAEDAPTFDVVFRDRLGDPLIVADCVDSREPVDDRRVASLVTAATEAKHASDGLAGAILTTTSFFDPGALGTAEEATGSGLLGGGSRESYVTVSRRTGYHLCLVEMRDAFHVRMPEL
jgi:hypothetical protein